MTHIYKSEFQMCVMYMSSICHICVMGSHIVYNANVDYEFQILAIQSLQLAAVVVMFVLPIFVL